MKISYVPVVDAMEVMDETNAQFGTDYLWVNLVPEMQENDSYFAFYVESEEDEEDYEWIIEHGSPREVAAVRCQKLVREYLRDVLPGVEYVIMTVSW